jgi:alcohol dehydrogenase (cytochrome c)
MTTKERRAILFLGLLAGLLPIASGQGLDPRVMTKALADSWPMYSGDYSSRRYSSLSQINQTNVKNLALAWTTRLATGPGGPTVYSISSTAVAPPTIVGGEVSEAVQVGGNFGNGPGAVVGGILEVNGILYMSAPDNAWAVDAEDGTVIWHFFWKTKGGTHVGNRGMGMYGDWVYFETPDDYLVCLDARTGKERWHKEIADFDQQYFSTTAPLVIGNHLIVGTGDDLDAPGFLQSYDPETGELQWKLYTVPMKAGDPGLDTWASLDAASHGGGQAWTVGAYDPETHLYIFGTGNPTPANVTPTRGEGDNLFTCSLLAVNVETGKMAWYFQTSPHDTHDWDSTQTPVLVDGLFAGRQRKLVMQGTRNGYFFVLDRVTGEHLLTSKFSQSANWAERVDERGEPKRNPEKDFTVAGSLVSPSNLGATNWPPPSFNPETGLFYICTNESFSMYFLMDPDPREVTGLGGGQEVGLGSLGTSIEAIDYKTGKIVWKHLFKAATSTGIGLLSTAGKLLFGSDPMGNFIAFDPATGAPLWHARIGQVMNAPETYMLGGKQYVLVSGGDIIYAFALN